MLLVQPDQTIVWANQAALDMHGVATPEELGGTVEAYRKRFELRYRNNHRLPHGEYPIDRVVAGEAFDEVVVEVVRAGHAEPAWVHRVRSMVLTDAEGEPDVLVLVLTDETGRAEAEARFETMFGAPGAGGHLPARRPALCEGQPGFPGAHRPQARTGDRPFGYEVDVLEARSAASWRSSGSARATPSRKWRPA